MRTFLLLLLLFPATGPAQGPQDLLADYAGQAQRDDPGLDSFSAERGAAFFRSPHGRDWSCATCHTDRPVSPGRHAVTGKRIAPLAPAANPRRFTDPTKVAKWFRRNCKDVLGRPCSAAEKGDVLTWLLGLRP